MSAALRRLFSEQRPATLLGLLRIAFACLLLNASVNLAITLRHVGYFGDFFFMPLVSESWVPSRLAYTALLALKIIAAACAVVGLAPRASLLVATSIGLYLLACDRLQYHNNRYALHLLCFLLAFTPCDRSFRLPFLRARSAAAAVSEGPFWAVRLLQLQVSAIYASSALGKLFDADWRGGQVILLRFARAAEVLAAHGCPSFVTALLGVPSFANLASKVAIANELFLAIGLWLPGTRALALWLGVMFHIGIEIAAQVESFSWLMVSSYVAFVTPELRERTLRYDAGNRRARLLGRLVASADWLLRFRVLPGGGARLEVIERDGSVQRGARALTAVARGIPLLFPIWLPLAIATRLGNTRWTGRSRSATVRETTHDASPSSAFSAPESDAPASRQAGD